MPPRDWQLRIQDILDAIAAIGRYVQGLDLDAFRQDQRTQDAVEFRFAIIGEAASGVPEHIAAAHPEIPWRIMRNMRNIMIHVYVGIDAPTVWGTIQHDLPPLVPLLKGMLAG